ncbi:hypothetical protein PHYPSEUDO_014048 [Phytophthora pseudosyringae]|uniref:Uncharacterized protein n=1 Tax=Phytophthora pseudosyringae TaxID=221518 RepID=A0A8T1W2P7_9STRA|nr:hypothetical protein PHYPSEUDO_014048 [Phytophthora pseudosyringae]
MRMCNDIPSTGNLGRHYVSQGRPSVLCHFRIRLRVREAPSQAPNAMHSAALKTCRRAASAGRVLSARTLTTYSGGQPSEGQGGFYGSAKTRSESGSKFSPGARAEPQDLTKLQKLMKQWEAQKTSLAAEEHKKALARIASEEETLIQRLLIRGAPVWGLSTQQREFVAECSKASP